MERPFGRVRARAVRLFMFGGVLQYYAYSIHQRSPPATLNARFTSKDPTITGAVSVMSPGSLIVIVPVWKMDSRFMLSCHLKEHGVVIWSSLSTPAPSPERTRMASFVFAHLAPSLEPTANCQRQCPRQFSAHHTRAQHVGDSSLPPSLPLAVGTTHDQLSASLLCSIMLLSHFVRKMHGRGTEGGRGRP